MEKEERDRIMDGLLSALDDGDDGHFSNKSNRAVAIRECDKLARAWDVMYQEVDMDQGNEAWKSLVGVRQRMESLLRPTPKGPLEELEGMTKITHKQAVEKLSTAERYDIDYYRGVAGTCDRILAEIRRLKEKK